MPLALASAASQISTVTTADDGWYRSITSFAQHTAWLQSPMKLYTTSGIGLLCVMALYAAWRARGRADHAAMAAVVWLALGTVISIGAGLTLKQVFHENRPCQAMHVPTVETCPGPSDYSFPSDHTIFAVALAVGLWLVSRKLGIIAVILAAIEAFDRVYTGQHYPHDILAAAIVSTVIMLAGWALARRPLTALLALLLATPLRPLLTTASAPVPTPTPAPAPAPAGTHTPSASAARSSTAPQTASAQHMPPTEQTP